MIAFSDTATCSLEEDRRFWLKQTDVSEVCTASIIALMTETVRTAETSINFNGLHGATSQKAVFILAAVRT
jgi:hypothetical protein